jgi:DNA mismatch repair ATPase MutS
VLARLLGIKLASRMWGGKRVFMAGFPLMHLDKHLKALVQTHARCVALCEEFPRAHLDGGGFERRVVRVVTPGTLLDESFVDPYTNNYLLAVSVLDGQEDAPVDLRAIVVPQTAESLRPTTSAELGLAWIDVSTGEFFAKSCPLETLRDELVRLVPREVVLSSSLQDRVDHPVRRLLAEEGRFVSYVTPCPPADTQPTPYEERSFSLHDPVGDEAERSLDNLAVSSHLDSDLRDEMPADDLVPEEELTVDVDTDAELPSVELSATRRSPSNSDFSPSEDAGIRLLTSFLSANLLEHMPRLSLPSRESSRPRMRIDAYTLTSLEIRQGLREGGVTGSLLSSVKRTTTGGGARLLARWLAAPSTSAREIRARQALVAHFHARPHLREDLRLQLAAGGDASRLVQRLLARRGDAADLAALAETIAVWAAMRRAVALEREMEARERGAIDDGEWASLDALMARMSDLQSLGDRIELALQRRTPPKMGEVSPDEEGGQRASEDAILGGAEVWTIKPE